jgi:hypothetical protein
MSRSPTAAFSWGARSRPDLLFDGQGLAPADRLRREPDLPGMAPLSKGRDATPQPRHEPSQLQRLLGQSQESCRRYANCAPYRQCRAIFRFVRTILNAPLPRAHAGKRLFLSVQSVRWVSECFQGWKGRVSSARKSRKSSVPIWDQKRLQDKDLMQSRFPSHPAQTEQLLAQSHGELLSRL